MKIEKLEKEEKKENEIDVVQLVQQQFEEQDRQKQALFDELTALATTKQPTYDTRPFSRDLDF